MRSVSLPLVVLEHLYLLLVRARNAGKLLHSLVDSNQLGITARRHEVRCAEDETKNKGYTRQSASSSASALVDCVHVCVYARACFSFVTSQRYIKSSHEANDILLSQLYVHNTVLLILHHNTQALETNTMPPESKKMGKVLELCVQLAHTAVRARHPASAPCDSRYKKRCTRTHFGILPGPPVRIGFAFVVVHERHRGRLHVRVCLRPNMLAFVV